MLLPRPIDGRIPREIDPIEPPRRPSDAEGAGDVIGDDPREIVAGARGPIESVLLRPTVGAALRIERLAPSEGCIDGRAN